MWKKYGKLLVHACLYSLLFSPCSFTLDYVIIFYFSYSNFLFSYYLSFFRFFPLAFIIILSYFIFCCIQQHALFMKPSDVCNYIDGSVLVDQYDRAVTLLVRTFSLFHTFLIPSLRGFSGYYHTHHVLPSFVKGRYLLA